MEMRCPKINRRLLPVKIHYFLFFAALACALPFRTVFAKRLGISATAIGVIFCAVPFVKIITNPLFGFLIDYFKRFRLILSIIMIFVALSHIAITFIPPKIVVVQNTVEDLRKDFHSKLANLLANDSIPSSCHPSLTLNMEYTPSQEYIAEPNSFICDFECSTMYYRSSGSERKCLMQIESNFKMFVHIHDCDIDVEFAQGKVSVLNTVTYNLVLLDVRNFVGRKVQTHIPHSKNCSLENAELSSPISSKNTQNKRKKSSNKNAPKVDNEDAFKFLERYINNEDTEKFISTDGKYLVVNEYFIYMKSKEFCMDFCNAESICRAKECSLHNKTVGNNIPSEENEFLSPQFWYFFVLMVIASTTLSAIIFLMDAVTYELLQGSESKYGEQRLWGTVGWGVGALIGGCLNQIATNDTGGINYAPSFFLLGVVSLIDLIPIYRLKVTNFKYSPNICKDVCLLLTKIHILYNIFIVFIIGTLSGFIWNYQFWFMEEIGSSQVLLGLSQTFESMFELPCFIAAGWIIMKIGHSHCNNITLLCFGLRYWCFAVMYDPWWTLAAGLLHGPTFGLFYASMTLYAKNEAPSGTEATVQSLLHLCFEGLGVAAGSLLGGVGIDKYGSRKTFKCAGLLSLIVLFINIIATFLLSKVKKENKRESTFVLSDVAE